MTDPQPMATEAELLTAYIAAASAADRGGMYSIPEIRRLYATERAAFIAWFAVWVANGAVGPRHPPPPADRSAP